MTKWKRILSSLINSVRFWKDKDVPGVADQIRKTKLIQDQRSRQLDAQELLRMVDEGRLHEADERQLENLKLALELNELLGVSHVPSQPAETIDSEQLVAAVKQAISEGMSNVTVNAILGEDAIDPSRPQMKHTSLSNLAQSDVKVDISHRDAISKDVEGEESSDTLEKLKRLKGK